MPIRQGRCHAGVGKHLAGWGQEFAVFTEPQQGATYDDLLAVALEAERLGFGAFFRSDHYLAMGDRRADRRDRATPG